MWHQMEVGWRSTHTGNSTSTLSSTLLTASDLNPSHYWWCSYQLQCHYHNDRSRQNSLLCSHTLTLCSHTPPLVTTLMLVDMQIRGPCLNSNKLISHILYIDTSVNGDVMNDASYGTRMMAIRCCPS